jgi:hypothetical protein
MATPSTSISIDSGDTPRTEAASYHEENGYSIIEELQQPQAQLPRPQSQQSQRRIKSPTKLNKLKPHLLTPPRMTRRANSSAVQNGNGNHAVEDSDEGQAPAHSGNTLESYVLPRRLRMNRNDVNFVTSGIEVIKVSKVSMMD